MTLSKTAPKEPANKSEIQDTCEHGFELDDPIPFGNEADILPELYSLGDLDYINLLMETAYKYRFSIEMDLETTQSRINTLLDEDKIESHIRSNELSLDITRKTLAELAYLKALVLNYVESLRL